MNKNFFESDSPEEKRVKRPCPKGWGYRHQQCLVLLISLTTAYSIRSCMGVALIAMTDVSELNPIRVNENDTKIPEYETDSNGFWNAMMLTAPYPTFDWSKKVQGIILSSFFWGYMSMQVPGGMITLKIGARKVLTAAMMINAISFILLPWAALYGNWPLILICRIIQGMSQAFIFPGMHTFFGKWAPLHERSRLAAYAYGGQAIGVVTGTPLAGVIASSGMGWPGVFRVYGIIIGFVGWLLWWVLADTPAQHPKISKSERLYIEQELGHDETGKNRPPTPWCAILKSRGMWAIVSAHIGQTIAQIFLYTEIPSYIDKVLKIDLKLNGLLVALPFLVMWLMNFFFGWLTDLLITKNILSVTNARKFASTIGCVPASIFIIILCYVPDDVYIFETILIIIGGIKVAAHSGYQVNHIDISPNFAGTMMSISNFISNGFGSFAPTVTSAILNNDSSNKSRWRIIFFMLAAVIFLSNLFYVIFGTAEIAPWNEVNDKGTKDDDKDEEVQMVQLIKKIDDTEDKPVCGTKDGYVKVSISEPY